MSGDMSGDPEMPAASPEMEACEKCDFQAEKGSENKLDVHMVKSHFFCKFCLDCKPDFVSILRHLEVTHKQLVQCDNCDFRTYPKVDVQIHSLREHFDCHLCEDGGETKEEVLAHYKEAHPESDFAEKVLSQMQCDCCDFIATSSEELRIHFENSHAVRFACEYCDFRTSSHANLRVHLLRRERNSFNLFTCDSCDFRSCTNTGLSLHKAKAHDFSNEPKVYPCDFCPNKYGKRALLNDHVRSKHLKDQIFACSECSFTSYVRSTFNAHRRSKHGASKGEKRMPMTKPIRATSDEVMHLVELPNPRDFLQVEHTEGSVTTTIVHEEKKKKSVAPAAIVVKSADSPPPAKVQLFQCFKCAFTSTTKDGLRKHVTTVHYYGPTTRHSGMVQKGPKIVCENCDFFTVSPTIMKNHNKIRLMNKNLTVKCDWCTFKSCTNDALACHKSRVHGLSFPNRTFKCDICGDRFGKKEDLKSHVPQAHANIKYSFEKCSHCDFRTDKPNALRAHKHSNHKEKIINLPESISVVNREESPAKKLKLDVLPQETLESANSSFDDESSGMAMSSSEVSFNDGNEDDVEVDVEEITMDVEPDLILDPRHRFSCNRCDFRSTELNNLRVHMEAGAKAGGEPEACDLCGFRSCTAAGLSLHRSRVHNVSSLKKPFKCDSCNTFFARKALLRDHVTSIHLKSPAFQCDNCDFKTHSRSTFNTHKRVKHGKRQVGHDPADDIIDFIIPEVEIKDGPDHLPNSVELMNNRSPHKRLKQGRKSAVNHSEDIIDFIIPEVEIKEEMVE